MKNITVVCWLKNNTEWFYPIHEIELREWENKDIISTSYYGDLIYCWNNDNKQDGRLYRTK